MFLTKLQSTLPFQFHVSFVVNFSHGKEERYTKTEISMAGEVIEERSSTVRNDDGSRGGWITIPFVVGTKIAVGVAASGLTSNLTVYLIQQFNIPRIDASQISNIVAGINALAPVIGAFVSDLGLGCFNVIWASSLAGFLGMLLFILITINPSLKPPVCTNTSTTCNLPTKFQLFILYTAIALVLAALGGTRFISATFGASQFDNIHDRAVFFDYYVVSLYVSAILGITIIVYVQIGIGWLWGFSLCAFLSAVGIVILLCGSKYYLHPKPQKSPLLILFEKLRRSIRIKEKMYYDSLLEGSNKEEEEEDLSSIITLIPIMSTGVIISICYSMISNFNILQALVMSRELFSDFTIPASSMPIFIFLATVISAPLFRHVRCTPLQRICVGYVITTSSVIISALTEAFRLNTLTKSKEKMHVLWLVPGLVLAGVGEAWHFPGFLEFYYREIPESLSSLSTGMIALVGACGFFASASLVELVRKVTPWLKNDLNESRLDYVYWMVSAVGVLNLVYFLLSAKFYKRRLV